MTWLITVKPTNHDLVAYTWTAQRADGGEGYLYNTETLPSQAEALAEAQAEVTLFTQRMQLIDENSIINQEFTPVLDEE